MLKITKNNVPENSEKWSKTREEVLRDKMERGDPRKGETVYEHDFDIMFCVKTRESDPEKVTSPQLLEALLARIAHITLGSDGAIPKDSVMRVIKEAPIDGCLPKGVHSRIQHWLDAMRWHWGEGDAECRVEDMESDSEMQESCGSQTTVTITASGRRDA
jgi:hypothetical protein